MDDFGVLLQCLNGRVPSGQKPASLVRIGCEWFGWRTVYRAWVEDNLQRRLAKSNERGLRGRHLTPKGFDHQSPKPKVDESRSFGIGANPEAPLQRHNVFSWQCDPESSSTVSTLDPTHSLEQGKNACPKDSVSDCTDGGR